jgi:hypothetical protein
VCKDLALEFNHWHSTKIECDKTYDAMSCFDHIQFFKMGGVMCKRVHPVIIELPENEECCVCLTKENTAYMTLDCGHTIHARCIMKWWQEMPRCALTCPLCCQTCTGCYMIICSATKRPLCFFRRDTKKSDMIVITRPHLGRSQTYVQVHSDEDMNAAHKLCIAL